MNSKLFTFGLFTLLLVGFASAAFTTSTTSLTFSSSSSQTFTITNTDTSPLTLVVPSTVSITGENGYTALLSVSPSGTTTIAPLSSQGFTVAPQSIELSNFQIGRQYSYGMVLTNTINSSDTKTVNLYIQRNSYCQYGNRGSDLEIRDVNIDNLGTFGGDEDNWYPFEPITVELTVKNRASDRVDNIVVSYGLYNKNTNEFIIEKDLKSFDLKDGDDKVVSLNFSIDPKDLSSTDDPNDYVFYLKAYSDDLGEEQQCNSYSNDITIPRDSDFVVVGNLQMADTVQCDEIATINFKVWNIGDNDENSVSLLIDSRNIPGLKNKKIDVGDLDVLDNKKLSYDLEIPKNLTEGTYNIDFKVVDEDGSIFQNDNDKESIVSRIIKVKGNCELPTSVSITANLEADSYAAEESTVRVTVKNTGLANIVAVIDTSSLDSWATVDNIDPKTLSLNAGESKESVISFTPNKDVSGNKDFKIRVSYGSKVTEQSFSVTVQPKRSIFSGLSLGNLFGDNWFIWVVAALNIILVVLIVVIAIKIAKK